MNNLLQQQQKTTLFGQKKLFVEDSRTFTAFMITKKKKKHQARCINLATVLRLCHKFDQLAKYGSFL